MLRQTEVMRGQHFPFEACVSDRTELSAEPVEVTTLLDTQEPPHVLEHNDDRLCVLNHFQGLAQHLLTSGVLPSLASASL